VAVLTSIDLHSRLSLSLHGYQFQLADNRCDLNFLHVVARVSHRGRACPPIRVRALTWELRGAADALDELSGLRMAGWKSRLLDSGLELHAERDPHRGDAFGIAALISTLDGPLPADLELQWDGARLVTEGGLVEGIRMRCSRSALGLFAAELHEDLDRFPVRRLPKNRLHLGQPT